MEAQGTAGWGQSSLLMAEKLAVTLARFLDPANEPDDFRLHLAPANHFKKTDDELNIW